MYKCGGCEERFSQLPWDANRMNLQCPACGSKIFYKVRPLRKKVVKAR